MKGVKCFNSEVKRKGPYLLNTLFTIKDNDFRTEENFNFIKNLFFKCSYNLLERKALNYYEIDAFLEKFKLKKENNYYDAHLSVKYVGKCIYNILEEKERNFVDYVIESRNVNKSFKSYFNIYIGQFVVKENPVFMGDLLLDIDNFRNPKYISFQKSILFKYYILLNFYNQFYKKMKDLDATSEFLKTLRDFSTYAVINHFIPMKKLFLNAVNINNKIKYFNDLPIYNTFGLLKECDYEDIENINENNILKVGCGFPRMLEDMEELDEYLKKYFISRYLNVYNKMILRNFLFYFFFSRNVKISVKENNLLEKDYENYLKKNSEKLKLTEKNCEQLIELIKMTKYFLALVLDVLISSLPKFFGFILISKNPLEEEQLEYISINDMYKNSDNNNNEFLVVPFINIDFDNVEYKKWEMNLKFYNDLATNKIENGESNKKYKNFLKSILDIVRKIKIENNEYVVNKGFEIFCNREGECELIKKSFEKYYKETSKIENIIKDEIDKYSKCNNGVTCYEKEFDSLSGIDLKESLKIDFWEIIEKSFKKLNPEKDLLCFKLFDDIFNYYYEDFLPPTASKENCDDLVDNITRNNYSIDNLNYLNNVVNRSKIYYKNSSVNKLFSDCIFTFYDREKYFNLNETYKTSFSISMNRFYNVILMENDIEALSDPFKRLIIKTCLKPKEWRK